MAKDAKKEAKAEKPEKTSRYLGRTSGLRVTEYQNQSIAQNAKKKLTDEELAKDWRQEFPKAKAFDAATVRTVRNLFNRGKHKNEAPGKPVPEFDDSGDALPMRGSKTAEAKASKSEAKEDGGKKLKFKAKKSAAA